MKWFSYDPNGDGMSFHDTEKKAQGAALDALELEQDRAGEGWSEEVTDICWGQVREKVEETERHPKREDETHEGDYTVSYGLLSIH